MLLQSEQLHPVKRTMLQVCVNHDGIPNSATGRVTELRLEYEVDKA